MDDFLLPHSPWMQRIKWAGLALFVIFLLLVGLNYLAEHLYYLRTSPEGVTTYNEWVTRFGKPSRGNVVRFRHKQGIFYCVSADVPHGLASPLGVPYYIFDREGKLVDWIWDIASDPDFALRWSMDDPSDLTDTNFARLLPNASN